MGRDKIDPLYLRPSWNFHLSALALDDGRFGPPDGESKVCTDSPCSIITSGETAGDARMHSAAAEI
jgi:hypothetical protein